MAGDSVILHKKVGINGALLIAVFGASMAYQEAQAFTDLGLGTAMLSLSFITVKYSLKVALKSLIARPKMIAVILSIFFYNEILGFAKDMVGYVVREFPEISLAVCLAALWYASMYSEQEEELPS